MRSDAMTCNSFGAPTRLCIPAPTVDNKIAMDTTGEKSAIVGTTEVRNACKVGSTVTLLYHAPNL